QGWDRSISEFTFAPDGASVVASVGHLGQTLLFRVGLDNGEVEALLDEGHASGPAFAGDLLVFTLDDLAHPAEIFALDTAAEGSEANEAGRPRALTSLNTEKLERAHRGEYEQFSFKGAGGDTVYGWLIKPANFDPAKRYPLAF